jgi:hypothetical protein
VGASTGGFTDVLLRRGAGRVLAVDVGYGQLHERLRAVLEQMEAILERHGVDLDPDTEVAVVPGTKTALVELAVVLAERESTVLLPDPGYPDYPSGLALAAAKLVPLRLDPAAGDRPQRIQVRPWRGPPSDGERRQARSPCSAILLRRQRPGPLDLGPLRSLTLAIPMQPSKNWSPASECLAR